MDKQQNNKAEIAVKLRKLRAEYNFTQADIAKQLGISQQTYSKYENQDTNIDSATIINICRVYGISSDYLLGIDNTPARTGVNTTSFSASDADIELIVNRVLSRINKD
jgi:transcriptional regulator with XRE-family HTH domain